MMRRFVELAGGPGHARIAVLPMASSEAAESGAELVAEFDSLKAAAFSYLLDSTQAESPEFVRRLDSATENLRRGMHPKDAGLDALKRVRSNTVERRLRRSNGEPNFSLTFYVLNAKGEHAGVSLYAEDEDYRGWAENKDRGF
jgi:hypothetical protein